MGREHAALAARGNHAPTARVSAAQMGVGRGQGMEKGFEEVPFGCLRLAPRGGLVSIPLGAGFCVKAYHEHNGPMDGADLAGGARHDSGSEICKK